MQVVIERANARGVAGIRLVQAVYHNRSLCLYTRLGFQTRTLLSVMQGAALDMRFPGYEVRPATEDDIPACNALCRKVHGFDRGSELAESESAPEQRAWSSIWAVSQATPRLSGSSRTPWPRAIKASRR